MNTPTIKQIQDTKTAIRMLVCVKLMPMIVDDLIHSCTKEGTYKHTLKYTINQVSTKIQTASDLAHQLFIGIDPRLGHDFLKRSDEAIAHIDESILIQGVDRDMNILISLFSLVEDFLAEIRPMYDFRYAKDLQVVKDRLKRGISYNEQQFIKPLIGEVLKNLKINVE